MRTRSFVWLLMGAFVLSLSPVTVGFTQDDGEGKEKKEKKAKKRKKAKREKGEKAERRNKKKGERRARGAKVGNSAPLFRLKDQNGKPVALKKLAGKIVVLEWTNPGCPVWVAHHKPEKNTMVDLAKAYNGKDVVWLAVNSTAGSNVEKNQEACKKFGIGYAVLDDSHGNVGRRYGAKTTPHMFVIGKNGKLVYSGAIDNQKEGEGAINYVRNAIDALLAGKAVETAETRPYGCGVKFAKAGQRKKGDRPKKEGKKRRKKKDKDAKVDA